MIDGILQAQPARLELYEADPVRDAQFRSVASDAWDKLHAWIKKHGE